MSTATADMSRAAPSLTLTTISVCLAAGMQSMDTFIAGIALPSMMGAFSAAHDEVAWVLTSFLIAVGVFTPLTAWLSRRVGRKRLLLIAIVGFCAASVMSGMSNSIPQIVPWLFLDGVVRGTLGITAAILITAMLADVVESSELETGRRSEGLFFAFTSLVQKAVSGVGVFAAGQIIVLINFPKGANPADWIEPLKAAKAEWPQ